MGAHLREYVVVFCSPQDWLELARTCNDGKEAVRQVYQAARRTGSINAREREDLHECWFRAPMCGEEHLRMYAQLGFFYSFCHLYCARQRVGWRQIFRHACDCGQVRIARWLFHQCDSDPTQLCWEHLESSVCSGNLYLVQWLFPLYFAQKEEEEEEEEERRIWEMERWRVLFSRAGQSDNWQLVAWLADFVEGANPWPPSSRPFPIVALLFHGHYGSARMLMTKGALPRESLEAWQRTTSFLRGHFINWDALP
jgi:hypothetical protein